MKHKLLLIIFFAVIANCAISQELNFVTVDKQSYEYYINSDWSSLIKLGNKSIDNNVDFYYLRMRMGIAFYAKKNFRLASKHFERAMLFDSNSKAAAWYLYYSYLYGGLYSSAEIFAVTNSVLLPDSIALAEKKTIKSVYFETAFAKNNDIDSYKSHSIIGDAGIYGEHSINDENRYYHAGLTHCPNSRWDLYYGFSLLNTSNLQRISYFDYETKLFENDTKQNQFYFSASHSFKNKSNLSLSVQVLTISAEYYSFGLDEVFFPEYALRSANLNNYVANLSYGINRHLFYASASYAFSNLNDEIQSQIGGLLTFYPFGNASLYWTNEILLHYNTVSSGSGIVEKDISKSLIWQTNLGFKVHKNIWIDAGLSLGDMKNFSENAAFVVYNDLSTINQRQEFSLFFTFKRFDIFAKYQYFKRENFYIQFIDNENYNSTLYKYNTQTISGGITWRI